MKRTISMLLMACASMAMFAADTETEKDTYKYEDQLAKECLYLGSVKILCHDYEKSFEYYKQGMETFDTIAAVGVVSNRLKCLRGMGNAKFLLHEYAEALVYFKQELTGFAALDPYGKEFARAYMDVAKTLDWLPNYKAAKIYYMEAALLYKRLGIKDEYERAMRHVK